MYLHRLVYYGENRIRELGLQLVKEMKSILQSSQRNNPSAGLTGALVFNERYFVGILEGDRRRVSHMLVKIVGDRRLGGLVVLSAGPVEERMFDGWSLTYAGHSEEIDRIYLRYGIVGGLDPARSSATALVGIARDLGRLDIPAPHLPREPVPPPTLAPGETVEVIRVRGVMSNDESVR